MDNLNDLKAIWLTAKTDDLPGSKEMLRIVKKFRNERLVRKLSIIFIAIVIIILIAVTELMLYDTAMITTLLGGACTILACLILVFTNTRSMKRFIDLGDCNNKEFIEFLEQTRRNQLYYYKKTQVLGMAFSSLGLFLYLYETAYKGMTMFIIVYSIAIAFTLLLWLYIRPRNFKRQAIKLDQTLKKLEKVSEQIK